MHDSGVYLCSNLCTGLSDKQRERAPERQREILFVFLFCLYLPAFLRLALKLCQRQRG